MKVAIWHNLPSGGGKRALYLHTRGLVERGHVVCRSLPSPKGVRESIVDGVNGLLVGANRSRLRRLLAEPSLARQLGENGCRLFRERWSLEAATLRLEKHLQDTLNTAGMLH